jgi:hypothetical protein
MQTKYNIGDCLKVVNDYNEVFACDVTEIMITKNNVIYKLSNGKSVAEISNDNSYYRILGVVGNINDKNKNC